MKTKRLISFLCVSLLLSGCSLLGAIIDSGLSDKNSHYFQDLGKKSDQDFFTSEDAKFAKQRALKRNCKFGTEKYEECRMNIQPEKK